MTTIKVKTLKFHPNVATVIMLCVLSACTLPQPAREKDQNINAGVDPTNISTDESTYRANLRKVLQSIGTPPSLHATTIQSKKYNDITTSWYRLNDGIYQTLQKNHQHLKESYSKENISEADVIKGVTETIIRFQLAEKFLDNYYATAIKHKYSAKFNLIQNSLRFLREQPYQSSDAVLLLELEQLSNSLEKTFQNMSSKEQLLLHDTKQEISDAFPLSVPFYGQFASYEDLIINHQNLIIDTLNNWRILTGIQQPTQNDLESLEESWKRHFPQYPLLLMPVARLSHQPLESWSLASKHIIVQLNEPTDSWYHLHERTTPRNVIYKSEEPNSRKKQQELFRLTLLIQLRLALIDYVSHFKQFEALSKYTELQKIISNSSPRSYKSVEAKDLKNHIKLLNLELKQATAFQALLASQLRLIQSIKVINTEVITDEPAFLWAHSILAKHSDYQVLTTKLESKSRLAKYKQKAPNKAIEEIGRSSGRENMSTLSKTKTTYSNIVDNNDQFGIRLLKTNNHAEYIAHLNFSGLRDLPFRTQLKGYETQYTIYYATYPSRKKAEIALKDIPEFYKLFRPIITTLPN